MGRLSLSGSVAIPNYDGAAALNVANESLGCRNLCDALPQGLLAFALRSMPAVQQTNA